MKLSYRGVSYESAPTRRLLERETTAKYHGVEYVIQHFGEMLPVPEPNFKYCGASYRPCLSATQAKSRHLPTTSIANAEFFTNLVNIQTAIAFNKPQEIKS